MAVNETTSAGSVAATRQTLMVDDEAKEKKKLMFLPFSPSMGGSPFVVSGFMSKVAKTYVDLVEGRTEPRLDWYITFGYEPIKFGHQKDELKLFDTRHQHRWTCVSRVWGGKMRAFD